MSLPSAEEWNRAVEHSLAYPTHILGPYADDDGIVHMECLGPGDPYEPSLCDFDPAKGVTVVLPSRYTPPPGLAQPGRSAFALPCER